MPVALLAIGGGVFWYYLHQKAEAEAEVTAAASRLTREKDDGGSLKAFDRMEKPEVWFRVQLENVPLGRELALTCEWLDPTGRVAHRNRFRTKEITRTPWPTRVRYRLPADAPLGTWTVRLLLSDRELRSQTFEVRDGGKP